MPGDTEVHTDSWSDGSGYTVWSDGI